MKRRPQLTYHCPVPDCEKRLPHSLAWPVVAEIERTREPVPYECPHCSTLVCQVLLRRDAR